MIETMSPEERRLFDARADLGAWEHCMSILEPWVRIVREIGTDELTRVMEKALAEVEGEANRARGVLESIEREGDPPRP